jgi:hypothetical protein
MTVIENIHVAGEMLSLGRSKNKIQNHMNQEDINELLSEEDFTPFVITTHSGFIVAIGPEQRKHVLAGARTLVTMDPVGNLIHIPYKSIATIIEIK